MQEISLSTERKTQVVEITRDVQEALDGADGAAAALVFVPHTTAGLTINEHADPAVARDLEKAMERIVGDDWGWEHIEAGEENAPSHVRAVLAGPQVVVPVEGGRLALGTWQGIFFCEFDGPRTPQGLRYASQLIEVEHLTKRFRKTVAVDDLSFKVREGTITGFLGPNGAGKTTTLRIILGLVRATAGPRRSWAAPIGHSTIRPAASGRCSRRPTSIRADRAVITCGCSRLRPGSRTPASRKS